MVRGTILNCEGDFLQSPRQNGVMVIYRCFLQYFNNILALPNLLLFSHPSEFNSIALNNNKEIYLFIYFKPKGLPKCNPQCWVADSDPSNSTTTN